MTGKKCENCGKAAYGTVGGVPICFGCATALQLAHNAGEAIKVQQVRHAMAMMNQSLDDMDAVTGFRSGGRVQIPTMPSNSTTTVHVENSGTIGVINTANVNEIQVSIGQMQTAGMDKLEAAVVALTEQATTNAALDVAHKNELLEQIAFLSRQATGPASERKPGIIKATMAALGNTASTVASIATAWQVCAPLFKAVFGI